MNSREEDFYTRLRVDIKQWLGKNTKIENRWTEYILLAPDIFHLLVKLSLDPDVPNKKKLKLAGAITYFISPVDLMPEVLMGPVGYLDDIALAAYVLNDVINDVDPAIVSKYWAGERDILDVVKTILANANAMIGSGLWKKIRKKF